MNPELPVNEIIIDTLKNLEETDAIEKVVIELISKHPNDYGEIVWIKEPK